MSAPILKGKFAPLSGFRGLSTLELHEDAVVWRRPWGSKRYPITDIERVDWSATQGSGANFALHLSDGETISGNLIGAALWKFKLKEMATQRGDGYARIAGLTAPPEPPKPHQS